MEAFLASFAMVAIAEMGDKTQLLSFVLAAKFRGRHWPLIAGIFAATVANHFVAAYLGDWVAAHVEPEVMRWVLGVGLGLAVIVGGTMLFRYAAKHHRASTSHRISIASLPRFARASTKSSSNSIAA